jgi:hypothetical protein
MVPAAGTWVTIMLPDAVQLSVIVAAITGIAAWQPAPAPTTGGTGSVITGASLSVTETLNEHVTELPPASVIWKVFMVVPTGNVEPDGEPEVCVIVIAQLSVAVGRE